ncbi:MAG: ABC transporter permease [Salinivirgaceae bacterium]|nr:ABC transporter permease [Salinivirgaceae bacterium]
MIKSVVQQIGYSILVLFGVVSLVFALFIVLPGDPAQMMVGQRSDEQTLQNIRNEYGFNQPVWKQYLIYLNDLSPVAILNKQSTGFGANEQRYTNHVKVLPLGNTLYIIVKPPYLRNSYQSKQPVFDSIKKAFPNTMILAMVSILVAALIGITFGAIAAIYKGTVFDKGIVSVAALGMSLPSFFAAILIGWLFAFVLSNYTHLNLTGSLYELNPLTGEPQLVLKNLILPALTLSIRPLSVFVQLTRNSLLQENSSEYFITSLAKGNTTRATIWNHTLKNALNPVITAISGWFASMLAGVVFVEYIFGWKGLGELLVNALNNYDFPIVMGCILIIAFMFLMINIVVDIIYKWLDPRVRYQLNT